jgi:TolA-binding protein
MSENYRIQSLQISLRQAEAAQRVVPIDLDDLWKTTDVNHMTDEQFARWLTQKLDRHLFEYRAMRSGRDIEQTAKLQAAHKERDELLQQRDKQIAQLTEQSNQIVPLKDRIGELQQALKQMQKEKEELSDDLETSGAQVMQLWAQLVSLASQVNVVQTTPRTAAIELAEGTAPAFHFPETDSMAISTTAIPVTPAAAPTVPVFDLVTYPAPPDQTPDWYSAWLATTKPEDRDRQSAVLYAIGQGQAFIRDEVVEYLNSVGLLNESDFDKPGGFAGRMLRSVIEQGFVEEIDGGFGAAVPLACSPSQSAR